MLVSALQAAATLRQAGLDFIVAPLARIDGTLTQWLPPDYVLAVYPHIDGETATYGRYQSQERRRQVIDRLVVIHQATDLVRDIAVVHDLAVPKRADLEAAMETITLPWDSGPFGHEAQVLLTKHKPALRAALSRFDTLAEKVSATRDRWVITHGEPHRGNTIVNEVGVQLIDWETARIAPPERDLWALIDEDARSRIDYIEASGRAVDDDALKLYRSWWSLCEVSLYTDDLRSAHADTAETQIAWQGLREHMALATRPAGH